MVYTVTSTYSKNILCIYHVHCIYIVCTVTSTYSWNIIYILYVYTMYIHRYTWYIMCLCSTWRLMLQRRTGSHSTGSTSNDMAWRNFNFKFSPFLHTLAMLAPGQVYVQGVPGTENSQEVQCLTGKTYKQSFQSPNWSQRQQQSTK